MTDQLKPKHFEEALQRLEGIVAQMESGDGNLEESLTLFEEGMTLLSFCKDQLQTAEQKIEELSGDSPNEESKDHGSR